MTPSVPELLEQLRAGDERAMGQLVQALYDELHLLAASKLRGERTGHTLQTTALVHEVYLKLVGENQRSFADRGHFLAVAARVMRQVLVDYARARATKKRSAGFGGFQMDDFVVNGNQGLLDLDLALEELAKEDPMLAEIIEMRYFGGLTAEETAAVLNRSVHVVRHDIRLAQAWLRRNLSA